MSLNSIEFLPEREREGGERERGGQVSRPAYVSLG
jgi:hypothetical protein